MNTTPRRALDTTGFWLMLGLALLFGVNNVLIKLGNGGLQPVIFAGLRSLIAALAIALWMAWRGIPARLDLWRPGLLMGLLFSSEFVFLFIALDHTSVVRASSIFYAMPLWLALAAHVLFPGERLTPWRGAGFLLGFAGVVLTFAGRAGGFGDGTPWGDLAALVAGLSWAEIVVVSRRGALGHCAAETQLLWQTAVSALLLCAAAPRRRNRSNVRKISCAVSVCTKSPGRRGRKSALAILNSCAILHPS